ncbi:MAG: GNAT family N-acetyltransferase [Bacilli bacterium]|nr:GNAT family N-acetyltransferase [Bacilli bacterium]
MIRKAKIEEVQEINKVIDDAKALFKQKGSTQWQDLDGYPNVKTLTEDIIKDTLYVKEMENKIVGVVAISKEIEKAYDKIYEGKWLNDEPYYVVHRLAVKKEYYGKGIARELMDFSDNVALNDGVFNIKVDTMENNTIMTNLLTKCGYVNCGVIYLLRKDVLDKRRLAFQKVLTKQ